MSQSTRTEKKRLDYRAPDFTVTDVELSFSLDLNATIVTAVSHVVRKTTDKSAPLVLDGDSLKLLDVKVNGAPCAWAETPTTLTLNDVPDEFDLTIKTQIAPAANTALMGLYVSDGKFCTQCEPEGFRRITYFLDHPDVLARYTTHVSAKAGAYPFMLSNGNMIADETKDGVRTVTWQDPFPKPSYLFALVAGDFDELSRTFKTKSGREVAVRLYVDRGQAARGTIAIESILKAMAWDEQRFGLEYDLDRFNVVAVDFFNAGAMENKSLNIFNSKFVLADAQSATDTDMENVLSVIGHEYFHNWTGDRVTCRDWFQLSLKEGLTVFRDQEFSSDLGCRPIERIKAVEVIRGPQFAEDASPMAHPIRPDYVMEMNNFYSVTVYDKGAEVIRMMHTILGEEKFQAGMQLYFKRHDGRAVTCEDFVSALEDASGVDLKAFRNWYSQAGTPVVTVGMAWDENAQTCTLSLRQKTPATPRQSHKEPFVIPMCLAFYTEDGQRIALKRAGKELAEVQILSQNEETWVFDEVAARPVVALLGDFSAPVKLEYPYTDTELNTLLKYAADDFIRFDAVQSLINRYVEVNVSNYERKQPFTTPASLCAAFKFILKDQGLSRRFKAFMLRLPSINTLLGLFKVVDVTAVCAVYNHLADTLATELGAEFLSQYNAQLAEFKARVASKAPSVATEEQMGERALAGVTLAYSAHALKLKGQAQEASALVLNHFELADNMTDTLSAMNTACKLELACREQILAAYEAKWHDNALVFDNYFRAVSMAATPNTLKAVKALLKHPCFDINNPNRVRALVGSFAMANPECFHAQDGSGYEFLTDILIELNDSNPHVAARIMTPMISLNNFDEGRRAKIKACFARLMALPNLSTSIYEKIDKALNDTTKA